MVDLQVDALRRAGHEVELISVSQEVAEQEPLYSVRAALRVATQTGFDPSSAIRTFKPDVVHVHNLFPNMSRRWISHVAAPVVGTMHNYRPICPAATLFRDGHSCVECPSRGSALPALRHACFRGSRLATLPMVPATRFAADPLLRHARRVVALNDDMAATYASVGVDKERIVVVPNFVPWPGAALRHQRESFWLYVGRLTDDKGIVELAQRWPPGNRLVVVGAGPRESDLAALGDRVTLLGQRDHEEVLELMGRAHGLVFPSLWPEGLPTVYLEALAAGLPVLASSQSVVGTLVRQQRTGLVMSADLESDLLDAADFDSRREHVREVFKANYTEARWVAVMTDLYRRIVIE